MSGGESEEMHGRLNFALHYPALGIYRCAGFTLCGILRSQYLLGLAGTG